MNKSKVIPIDAGYLIHKSIYLRNRMLMMKQQLIDEGKEEQANKIFIVPSTYTFMISMISSLKKIGIDKGDEVLICCDGRNNWRKDFDKNYKATRSDTRAKASFVDWSKEFKQMNGLLEKINSNTPFFIVKAEGLEADDWISEACRFYKDREVIIVSVDSDFEMLLTYDNVRLFSNHPKRKNNPYKILSLDREKERKLAYKSLMKKVRKETADNLVTEIATEMDYDVRMMLVNLLQLPTFITTKIKNVLENIEGIEKDINLDVFSPGIRKRFNQIFQKDKIISYNQCYKKMERKLKKGKK